MYLISVYFDDKTNEYILRFMERIAKETGNVFLIENRVPPHLTILSVEAISGDILLPCVEQLREQYSTGKVQFVSVGAFFPYVLYLAPVLNQYLQELSEKIYQAVCDISNVRISRYYQPMKWVPHVTLGKKLSEEEMQTAFQIMQKSFSPFTGEVTSLGLAKVNPHEDLLRIPFR